MISAESCFGGDTQQPEAAAAVAAASHIIHGSLISSPQPANQSINPQPIPGPSSVSLL
jgi:hypothetical protein